MSQLRKFPMLIIAVVAEGSVDSHVTDEGQQWAEQNGASFLATDSLEWRSECFDIHVYKRATLRIGPPPPSLSQLAAHLISSPSAGTAVSHPGRYRGTTLEETKTGW